MTIASALAIAFSIAAMGAASAETGASGAFATSAAAQSQAKARRSDPNRMVCRREAVTGSRFPVRRCRRQADWDQDAEQTRDNVRDQQINDIVPPLPPAIDG